MAARQSVNVSLFNNLWLSLQQTQNKETNAQILQNLRLKCDAQIKNKGIVYTIMVILSCYLSHPKSI